MTQMHLSLDSIQVGENVATELIGQTMAKAGDDCPDLEEELDSIGDGRQSISSMNVQAVAK